MRQLRAGLGLATIASLAACSVPTDLPIFDQVWNVPAKSTTISVNSFLPSGVTSTSDNSAFVATVSPSTSIITRQLGQDCAACAAANGTTIPKPAFTGGGSATVALPAAATSVTLVRDTLTVSITNGFGFDPIRPSASARGWLTIKVSSGSTAIGKDSVDGSATAMASGAVLTRKIPLAGTVTGASGLQIVTVLNSPAGDPVLINTLQTMIVSGSTGTVFVSGATVNLASQSVTSSATDLDLSGVDSSITKRAGAGSLFLTVTNPFGVSGNLSVSFTGGSTPITKSITLATGTSTPSVSFTKADLKALFGHHVLVTFSGAVSGSSVTVAPGQAVSVASRLQVAITIGGN
jgi:hypothetical protein